MNKITFKSKLLPDGHLYCPKEFSKNKNAKFKVIVMFEDNKIIWIFYNNKKLNKLIQEAVTV